MLVVCSAHARFVEQKRIQNGGEEGEWPSNSFFEFYKDVDQFTGFFTEFSPNLELTLDFLFSRVSRNHIIFNNDGTFDLKGGM